MREKDLEFWENRLMDQIVNRRKIGEYSPDAMTILALCEINYELCRHIRERLSAKDK